MMHRNFKILHAAIPLIGVTCMVNANYAQMRNLNNRITALEERQSENCIINPNGRPHLRDSAGIFITADFLYWIGNEDGLGFVVKNATSAGIAEENTLSHAKLTSPNFKYEPGFRLGIGYNLPKDGWDIYADWTWLISKAARHVTSSSGGTLLPTFMNIQEIEFVTVPSANAHWRAHLNIIDLELGRQFFVSKWLTLRPHFGLRTAWVNQTYKLSYKGTFDLFRPKMDDIPGTVYSDDHCKFWGIGFRGGLNNQWDICHRFSFYGDLALSLLFGRFHTDTNEFLDSSNGSGDFITNNWKDKFTATRAVLDLAGGLRFGQYFCRERFYFRLQAGWEQHLFFSQNQFNRVINDLSPGITVDNQGDLSYNGLTISARFDF